MIKKLICSFISALLVMCILSLSIVSVSAKSEPNSKILTSVQKFDVELDATKLQQKSRLRSSNNNLTVEQKDGNTIYTQKQEIRTYSDNTKETDYVATTLSESFDSNLDKTTSSSSYGVTVTNYDEGIPSSYQERTFSCSSYPTTQTFTMYLTDTGFHHSTDIVHLYSLIDVGLTNGDSIAVYNYVTIEN